MEASAWRLCFVDTETTGLDPTVHQAYEVAWAHGDGDVTTMSLPHTLDHADPYSLDVGGYFDRGFHPMPRANAQWRLGELALSLRGVTLVGANPAFDAAFLRKAIGTAPWHHRLVDVESMATWVLKLDHVPGLNEVFQRLVEMGHKIPEPDHTAAGDVLTTRACFNALRSYT